MNHNGRALGVVLWAAILSCSAAKAEVPLTIAATGHALVPVAVEGHGVLPFVLDTGTAGSGVSQLLATRWGLPRALSGPVDLPPIALDNVAAEGLSAAVLAPTDGQALDGIVGLDLIGAKILDFDLPRRRMALLDNARAITVRHVAVVGRRVAGDLLAVPVFAGRTMAMAVIDTGARRTRINAPFARAIGLDPAISDGTAPEIRLGDRTLRDAPVLVADRATFERFGLADAPAAILGLDWLERTRMVVDFPRDRAWFLEAETGA